LELPPEPERLLAVTHNGVVRSFRRRPGMTATELRHGSGLATVRFTPDGSKLLSLGTNGTATLWAARSLQPLSLPRTLSGHILASSPDAERLLVASNSTAWLAATANFSRKSKNESPGRLLATVRSRCLMLPFAPLGDEEIDTVLRRDAPDADAPARAAAIAAARGSPGAALEFVEQRLGPLQRLMQQLVRDGDWDFALRGALADEIGTRPDRERQMAVLDLARAMLAQEAASATRERQQRIIAAHSELARLTAQAPTFNFDAGLLIMEIGWLLASAALPREAAR
jgi:hypothetical protein